MYLLGTLQSPWRFLYFFSSSNCSSHASSPGSNWSPRSAKIFSRAPPGFGEQDVQPFKTALAARLKGQVSKNDQGSACVLACNAVQRQSIMHYAFKQMGTFIRVVVALPCPACVGPGIHVGAAAARGKKSVSIKGRRPWHARAPS